RGFIWPLLACPDSSPPPHPLKPPKPPLDDCQRAHRCHRTIQSVDEIEHSGASLGAFKTTLLLLLPLPSSCAQ
ncbi:hypothetical protein COCCADRAFT_107978, partial [Bipolaris zeicola 26-R-13]